MDDAIFVAKLGVRWGSVGYGRDFDHAPLRIGIKHEELAGVGLRVAQEFEAVCFRTGERLFVAEDNPSRIVFELAGANKAAALAALVSTGQCIFLRVSVERRYRILPQNAIADPIAQRSRGARVDVVLRGVG